MGQHPGGMTMDIGASMFFTDYSMTPAALGRALEERGFESVWAPEHSHIPTSRRSPWPGGPELPKRYYDCMDPFVSLTAAAAVTTRLKLGTGVSRGFDWGTLTARAAVEYIVVGSAK